MMNTLFLQAVTLDRVFESSGFEQEAQWWVHDSSEDPFCMTFFSNPIFFSF
jgi:hypothetical protein